MSTHGFYCLYLGDPSLRQPLSGPSSPCQLRSIQMQCLPLELISVSLVLHPWPATDQQSLLVVIDPV